jgi:methanogenic corrinoid protein MtbC1
VTTVEGTLLDRYFDALVRCDPVTATDLVTDLLESGLPLSEIVDDVVVPAQSRVGQLWECGEWTVAQEHTATAVTEAAVSALWVMTARRELTDGPRVAVACAEGEWHSLPPRLAAALAAEAGADVTVLGPSMPADHLRRRLAVGDVDVLAVSCTVAANLVGAARCVAAAHAAGLPAVAGGCALAGREARARAIGADLLADGPQRLFEQPPAPGGDAVVPDEVLRLDAIDDTTLDQALRRARDRHPLIADLPRTDLERMREDLRWTARFTGAAVLTDDATVLEDYLGLVLRALQEHVPAELAIGLLDLTADSLEPLAPAGASVLRDAVRRRQAPA